MFHPFLRAAALTAVLGLCLAVTRPASADEYTIRGLGNSVNQAGGLNAQGVVTGAVDNTNGDFHAFLWQEGVIRDLGTLGGILSQGYAINDNGDVVGVSETTTRGDYHAYIAPKGGALRDIDGRAGRYSEAWGINSRGDAVGLAETVPFTFHAFFWNGSAMQDLGTLGGEYSIAYGINARRDVVGASEVASARLHATLWANNLITDLGVLSGGRSSYATAINDSGRVVGSAEVSATTGAYHAVLWDANVIADLGTIGGLGRNSVALGVNNKGQVVGWSSTDAADTIRHAVIWDNGVARDLNALIPADSGWVLKMATGINERGQILGEGVQNGASRLFVLTPATTSP
jgi:probable HAF family extracellular repeat protein